MGIRKAPRVTLAVLCREGGTEGEVLPISSGGGGTLRQAGWVSGAHSQGRAQSRCLEQEPSKALNLEGVQESEHCPAPQDHCPVLAEYENVCGQSRITAHL